MGFFTGEGVGIDLGSANTTVYLENGGIVLREPTSVLTMAEDRQTVLAVGSDAYAMRGRTGADTQIVFPVVDGAVTDSELAALTMIALAEKATGRRKPLEKAQLLVSMSQGLSRVEKAALAEAVRLTGCKRSALVSTSVAAALGAGLPVDQPKGTMVVVLGGGTTEIAVISMCAVVAARSMRTGAFSMDEAIVRYARRKFGLLIGLGTAEDLKCDIGSASLPNENFDEDPLYAEDGDMPEPETQDGADAEDEPPYGERVLLKGRDAKTGTPRTVTISTRDIAIALREPVRILIDAIRDALMRTPPEMAADILDNGVWLSGGGALLKDLPALLAEKTETPFSVSEHPHEDVILGLGRLATDERLLRQALDAGSAEA